MRLSLLPEPTACRPESASAPSQAQKRRVLEPLAGRPPLPPGSCCHPNDCLIVSFRSEAISGTGCLQMRKVAVSVQSAPAKRHWAVSSLQERHRRTGRQAAPCACGSRWLHSECEEEGWSAVSQVFGD